MKYWLSHLPLEVWVDVYRYPWISRKQMGRNVDRFRNRKYVGYLQFYLHDWGKRTLDRLHLDENGLYKYVDAFHRLYMDFPLAPMPANIKSFEYIQISHFNAQILNFLKQLGPILSKMNFLQIVDISPNKVHNLRTILAHMVPLLNATHSLSFEMFALPTVRQCFGEEKLARINLLSICHFDKNAMDEATRQTTVTFVMDWLTSSSQDGNDENYARCCEAITFNDNAFGAQISLAIREQFLMAKEARTFAVILRLHSCEWQFVEFHLNNNIGEELHGQQFGYEQFQISRHKANCGKELQEQIKESIAKTHGHGHLEIFSPTIGLLNAIMDVPGEDMEEADQQKPSISKEA